MIKVMYEYEIKTEYLNELMEKFKRSASEEFLGGGASNTGIDMYRSDIGENTYIYLDIFYNSLEDYKERNKFEKENAIWQDIWFNKNNKHKELSVKIMEKIN